MSQQPIPPERFLSAGVEGLLAALQRLPRKYQNEILDDIRKPKWSLVPNELWHQIISYADVKDRLHLKETNKMLYIAADEALSLTHGVVDHTYLDYWISLLKRDLPKLKKFTIRTVLGLDRIPPSLRSLVVHDGFLLRSTQAAICESPRLEVTLLDWEPRPPPIMDKIVELRFQGARGVPTMDLGAALKLRRLEGPFVNFTRLPPTLTRLTFSNKTLPNPLPSLRGLVGFHLTDLRATDIPRLTRLHLHYAPAFVGVFTHLRSLFINHVKMVGGDPWKVDPAQFPALRRVYCLESYKDAFVDFKDIVFI